MSTLAAEVRGLSFKYPKDPRIALDDVHFTLPKGARCLLLGRNGAGKSTLLHVLAGKHMIREDLVRVLGLPAFHDTSLAARVAFLGGKFPFDVDIIVGDVLDRTPNVDRVRLARLIDVLGVDVSWHMHRVSDGQRRRVQILLGLLRPPELLLLDEVTTDLDLIARQDLLDFLRKDTEERGASVLYATHILDGLDDWATDLALVHQGRMLHHFPVTAAHRPRFKWVEAWLRDPK